MGFAEFRFVLPLSADKSPQFALAIFFFNDLVLVNESRISSSNYIKLKIQC